MGEMDRLAQAEALTRRGDCPEDIRRWAREQGLPVGVRGRISKQVMEAYVAAHPKLVELPPVKPRKRRLTSRRTTLVLASDVPPLAIGKGWRITVHAATRAAELGFDVDELLEAACYPDLTYAQGERGPHEALYRKGDVAVGVDSEAKLVKTVLLAQHERWEHGKDSRLAFAGPGLSFLLPASEGWTGVLARAEALSTLI